MTLYAYFPRFLKLLIGPGDSHLLLGMVDTGIHTSIIGVQVFGLILYLAEYTRSRSKKSNSKALPFVLLFSPSPVLWGLLVSWFAIGFYNHELIPWSMLPGVRALTIWDHLAFATWALKGLIWITSGLLFIVTSFLKHT
jgi:hypothetical protein